LVSMTKRNKFIYPNEKKN